MKTIENKELKYKEVILKDETGVVLTILLCCEAVLNNSSYASGQEILKAFKISNKLKDEDGKINLEDADFEFIKTRAFEYKPFIDKGLVFASFFEALESASKDE